MVTMLTCQMGENDFTIHLSVYLLFYIDVIEDGKLFGSYLRNLNQVNFIVITT